ncbi:hypothetical protein SMB34_02030 [Thalassospira permensis NBRC 106175]|uniref:Uncharacterized protein n=1 Tax=Thalassospira permensis NBRC 106175 TaxID=1353532 RepID=A0ABR4TUT0_9PROT|nr:hypothetical protein SMB34_02030 [Thalassospira permensis NBRC 106175]
MSRVANAARKISTSNPGMTLLSAIIAAGNGLQASVTVLRSLADEPNELSASAAPINVLINVIVNAVKIAAFFPIQLELN